VLEQMGKVWWRDATLRHRSVMGVLELPRLSSGPAGLLAFQCDTCRQRKEFQRVRVVALVFCLFSSFMYTGSQRYSIREARLRCLQNLTMASYESFPVTKSAEFALECHEIEQLTVPVEGSGAVDAMAGMPWELIYPQIVGLRLRRGIVA
jgi:hypothetical protein